MLNVYYKSDIGYYKFENVYYKSDIGYYKSDKLLYKCAINIENKCMSCSIIKSIDNGSNTREINCNIACTLNDSTPNDKNIDYKFINCEILLNHHKLLIIILVVLMT